MLDMLPSMVTGGTAATLRAREVTRHETIERAIGLAAICPGKRDSALKIRYARIEVGHAHDVRCRVCGHLRRYLVDRRLVVITDPVLLTRFDTGHMLDGWA
jgi:hypothetical protein